MSGRILKILALLIAVSVPVILVFIFSKPSDRTLPQNNGLWCQSSYFRGVQVSTGRRLTHHEMDAFCGILDQNKIRYAFMFAGPFDTNGFLPSYAFSPPAIATMQTMKEKCPRTIALPWIGGIVNKTVFVDRAIWVSNAVNDTVRMVKTLGATGIHINLEFFTYQISDEYFPGLSGIERYGQDELDFLKKLREALPTIFISTVIVSTAPQSRHWKRKNTEREILEISKVVNQIAVLCYDTGIIDKGMFREFIRDQLVDIKRWKSLGYENTEYIIGIGTFVNKKELWRFRDLRVESIFNTTKTLKREIREPIGSEVWSIDGLAVFAEWTTDASEWEELRDYWFNCSF